jgi:hypothetical protein
LNDQPIYRPRRRRSNWSWPTWLKITFVLLVILLVSLIGWQLAPKSEPTMAAAETAMPAPQPTWTTFVSQTPAACYEAMEAADEVFQASLKSDTASLNAVRLASRSEYSAVPAAIKKAQDAGEELYQARKAYLKKAKACRT